MPSSTATTKQKAYLGGSLQLLERGGYKFFSEGIVIFQVEKSILKIDNLRIFQPYISKVAIATATES